jgi:hypothetical protein
MESRIEQLMHTIRQSSIYQQFLPQESGIGWPVPYRKKKVVYVILPIFGYAPFDTPGKSALFPPFATLTIDWQNTILVEYINLHFRNPWAEEQWEYEKHAGTFPHPAVESMTVQEYQEKRTELLQMYDEMFDALAERESFSSGWNQHFGQLLRLLIEPPLEPYYRTFAPKFFNQFLPLGPET